MRVPKQQQALRQVAMRLAEFLGATPSDLRTRQHRRAPEADAVIDLAGSTFVVAWKASGAAAPVSAALEQARRWAASVGRRAIPLVAVPFMGPAGRQRCQEADVAWLDLSGNARILAPGIRVRIEGEENQFKSRGRPLNVFAPKSARIARWLLLHPNQPMVQREIARATDMDEGFTSRIVSRLEEDGLIVRESNGAIRPRDPDLLVDAWREKYDFSKHQIIRGHVAARSGEELLHRLSGDLRRQAVKHAATGLAAAWQLTRFAAFRLVMLYVIERPPSEVLERLGFRDEVRGTNVWFVVPNDEGVFLGSGERDGVACVHPVQAYLDLQSHPERAKEAADHLRAELLDWGADG